MPERRRETRREQARRPRQPGCSGVAQALLASNGAVKGLCAPLLYVSAPHEKLTTCSHSMADIERVGKLRTESVDSPDSLAAQCHALYPGMKSFEQWAHVRGVKEDQPEGWNGVSLPSLFRSSKRDK